MSALPVGFGSSGYTVGGSLRFRSSATAYLSRTPTAAGNRKTWTWSGWVKFGDVSTTGRCLFGTLVTSSYTTFGINVSGQGSATIGMESVSGTTTVVSRAYTNAVIRDPSAWYHIIFAVDTTNTTATDRLKIYFNGIRMSVTEPNPAALNADHFINQANVSHGLMDGYTTAYCCDGYLADVNFIDGQALTPSSFGEFDATTGVWNPKKYTGTYGTNGFHLEFTSGTASAAGVGKDSSGNSNNWTPSGISDTALATTYDTMTDSPSNNYCVLNPLFRNASMISEGNSYFNKSTTGWATGQATMSLPASKTYFEATAVLIGGANSGVFIGIATATATQDTYQIANQWSFGGTGGVLKLFNQATLVTPSGSSAAGDIFQVAYDGASGNLWFGKNNTWYDSTGGTTGNPSTGANPTMSLTAGTEVFPCAICYANALKFNFGQRAFTYTPPTGYKALNTSNLPTPTIKSGDDYFKAYTYTGNGGGLQVGEVQKPINSYQIARSLRFRASNSAYLSRTPAAAGNRKTWTWSGWVKRTKLGVDQDLLSYYTTGVNETIRIGSDNKIYRYCVDTSGTVNRVLLNTDVTLSDSSVWYHIVVMQDTTQATNTNRVKIYVNGVQQSVSSTVWPALNWDGYLNGAVAHSLGGTQGYTDGYMAEVNFVDGQALTPTSFGTFDANGYWIPQAYTGTYGTNGFYLDFKDSANIGNDASTGGTNDWTPNNINTATTGITYDWMIDVPTVSTAGSNFAMWNSMTDSGTITAAGLNFDGTYTQFRRGTIGITSNDRIYIEVIYIRNSGNGGGAGFCNNAFITSAGALTADGANVWGFHWDYVGGTSVYGTNGSTSAGPVPNNTQTLMIAIDGPSNKAWFGIDGVWVGGGDPSTGANASVTNLSGMFPLFPVVKGISAGSVTATMCAGQAPLHASATYHSSAGGYFRYTPPTGFKALNTYNIAEVTTDLEKPDLVWIKSRSATGSHYLFDSVRGVTKSLSSDTNTAEATDVNSLQLFDKNGFQLGSSSTVNTSGTTYVAWAWKESVTAGFDIVPYTFTTTSIATINHSLGVAPRMILAKRLDSTEQWLVYHASGTTQSQYLGLNTTAAVTASANLWGSTAFTSTQFTFNATNGYKYVYYLFSDVEGFSKFGSYTGNGSTDGPYVYCGFRPRWIMVKRTDTGGYSWYIYDSSRNTYNVANLSLLADTSNAEGTQTFPDLVSNGFKIRDGSAAFNANGGTFIYAAFAEHPFKYSRAR